MKYLRVILEVCGAVLLAATLVVGSRPSAAQVSKETQTIKPAVPYAQLKDANYMLISALQDRVDRLEAKLATVQKDYAGHTHHYIAPQCQYENLATFKNELAHGATNMGVCLVNPAAINRNGTPTTPPMK
ncbi:MAG: hypothetical protein IPL89_11930 [Acidobacteria bacterium]|nr:hypothetical protein [Acidobacteriota bacterium]